MDDIVIEFTLRDKAKELRDDIWDAVLRDDDDVLEQIRRIIEAGLWWARREQANG